MSEEGDKAKKQEQHQELKNCQKCLKFFTNEQAYQTHIKMKHQEKEEQEEQEKSEESQEDEQEEKQSKDNAQKKSGNRGVPFKNRMLQIQRNDLEDNIYTFLGQLGQKNIEPTSRVDFLFAAENQKLTGQTNYSINKVIRTPYEESIKCSDEIPNAEIEKSVYKSFLLKLKDQLILLEKKIEDERQIWELRDPMAPEEEVMDEFSLMDIKKLIQNYPKRQIDLKYPHFSIFLLWIGRICKGTAFKEFYMILGEYLGEYYSHEANPIKGEAAYQPWKKSQKQYDSNKLKPQFLANFKIFDEKTIKKFVQYFVTWSDIFRALSI